MAKRKSVPAVEKLVWTLEVALLKMSIKDRTHLARELKRMLKKVQKPDQLLKTVERRALAKGNKPVTVKEVGKMIKNPKTSKEELEMVVEAINSSPENLRLGRLFMNQAREKSSKELLKRAGPLT